MSQERPPVQRPIHDSDAGTRLDVLVAREMGVSRGEAQLINEARAARVNGRPAKANYRLRIGDRIEAERPEPKVTSVEAEDIPLEVIYEDADLLVINKPRGLVVHPAPGNESGTLVN